MRQKPLEKKEEMTDLPILQDVSEINYLKEEISRLEDKQLELRKSWLQKRVKNHYKQRAIYTIIVIISIFIIMLLVYKGQLDQYPYSDSMREAVLDSAISFVGISLVVLCFWAIYLLNRRSGDISEIEMIEAKQRIQRQLPESESETSYFNRLVKINVENLGEYYTLVKIHTRNSFRASLAAGIVGFAFVFGGVIVALNNNDNQTVGLISATAGILINFIASVFFYLYNRTVRQLKEYHDSLLDVQNILLSFKIIEDIKDDATKAEMTTNVVKFLIARKSTDERKPTAEAGT